MMTNLPLSIATFELREAIHADLKIAVADRVHRSYTSTCPIPDDNTGSPSIRRFYSRDVESRLFALDNVAVEELCCVKYGEREFSSYIARYPASEQAGRPSILISAGIHGDEPAGVYAALDFLANVAHNYRAGGHEPGG